MSRSGHPPGDAGTAGDAPPAAAAAAPRQAYEDGRARALERARVLDGQVERLSLTRGIVFVALVGAAILVEALSSTWAWLAMGVGLALLVFFVLLVRRHRSSRREAARERLVARIHGFGLARLDRDWDAMDLEELPEGPGFELSEDHPWAPDLHCFGHASLYRLAGPLTTVHGRRRFASWLLTTPTVSQEVEARQQAVRLLAPAQEFRHRLTVGGLDAPPEDPDAVEAFLTWVEAPTWLAGERVVRLASWTLPPLTAGLGVASLAAGLPAFWLLPFVLQVVALRRVAGRVGAEVGRAGAGAPSLRRYVSQLDVLGDLPEGPVTGRIRKAVAGGGQESDGHGSGDADAEPGRRAAAGAASAHEALDQLRARLDTAESRSNMVYQALNYLVLLDVHAYRRLERWKERHGSRVRGWLEALGEAEALSALATVAHDHPDWTFPDMVDAPAAVGEDPEAPDRPHLTARALGHPLLRPEGCVRNDVEIGPPGRFLLVTGSNMSGKSTLLRAVGANAVLAQAGGPVCARELRMPRVTLRTSMMVGDSLEEGVSRFMAELLRLKGVVEAARRTGPGDPPVLYLLDEILQGTNTTERRIAARTVLRHLLERHAIGAVTTHDLTLHQAEDLERRADARHFRESVERGEDGRPHLHFEYRLRPGLSTTTNALELLEAVGLGREAGESPAGSPEDATGARGSTGSTGKAVRSPEDAAGAPEDPAGGSADG